MIRVADGYRKKLRQCLSMVCLVWMLCRIANDDIRPLESLKISWGIWLSRGKKRRAKEGMRWLGRAGVLVITFFVLAFPSGPPAHLASRWGRSSRVIVFGYVPYQCFVEPAEDGWQTDNASEPTKSPASQEHGKHEFVLSWLERCGGGRDSGIRCASHLYVASGFSTVPLQRC